MTPEEAYQLLREAYKIEVSSRQMQFTDSEDLKQHMNAVVRSLTAERPRLGIMMCGLVGNGKTTMVRAISEVTDALHARHLTPTADKWRIDTNMRRVGAIQLSDMAREDKTIFERASKVDLLFIDDIGTEPAEVMNFGNVISPIAEVLEQRYAAQKYTILTTNLNAKQVREIYGDRVADRLNEMVDVIIFKNKSYRR